ncbi:MAG: AraC family ligand binding domain-containing protein [Nitrospirae bacterium]|nr:AraC family ligand binding domain-containing protein [Nitrospirota bacterium]MBI3595366.1 AraC family ligand binding domain-containing protein [Nitrospirota bacterium]
MTKRDGVAIYPNGVTLAKWPRKEEPTAENVAQEMKKYGYTVYDQQTVAPWFERSRHGHDEAEIRGAISGVITFHFDEFPVTLEAGDILMIPGGIPHEVISHNGSPFSAYKGSKSGERKVTEYANGVGSVEDLAARRASAKMK